MQSELNGISHFSKFLTASQIPKQFSTSMGDIMEDYASEDPSISTPDTAIRWHQLEPIGALAEGRKTVDSTACNDSCDHAPAQQTPLM